MSEKILLVIELAILLLFALMLLYRYISKIPTRLKYQITSNDTAKVVGYSLWWVPEECTIPETTKIKGKTYEVTAIGKNAFKNCKKLKSVKIPFSVISIESCAF